MTRAELKRKSKEQIQGHIPKLFLCTLVSNILSSLYIFSGIVDINRLPQILNLDTSLINNFVSKYNNILAKHQAIFSIISIFSFIIFPAVCYSLSKALLCTVRNKEFTIKDFFKNICDVSIIKKSFLLSILRSIYIFSLALLFMLLEFIAIAFILSRISPQGTPIGLITLIFIIPILIVNIYIIGIPYSMHYYILIDNPDMTAKEVLKESKSIMQGHKLSYIILQLSFIGWLFLNAVTLGLVTIYSEPYYRATITNFYEDIKQHKNF